MEKAVAEKWYDQRQTQYEDFRQAVESLLKTLLQHEKIPYHSVNGRLKARDSYVGKCERKEYESPEQVMDLAGLRVITHTTAEVERVCEVIEREFQVDAEHSGNKAREMGVDKVGYLSVHYVVRMSAARLNLPEYARFNGLCCEIQVRSLLQHAWAEIEHDRGYKFTGKLPEEIERRFHLVAGTLELMDHEFRALSEEIDAYAERVKKETREGNLDIPIDSTSLLSFLNEFFKDHQPELLVKNYQAGSEELIEELAAFGVETLRQLNDLMNEQDPLQWRWDAGIATYLGVLRTVMVLTDGKKYFETAWQRHWNLLDEDTEKLWKEHGVSLDELSEVVSFERQAADNVLELFPAIPTGVKKKISQQK